MMYANEEEEQQQTTSPQQSRPVFKKPSGLAPLKLQLKTKVKNLDAVDGGACNDQEDFTTDEIITPESSTCSSVTSDTTPSSPAIATNGAKRQVRTAKKPVKLQKRMHLDKLQVPSKTNKQEPKEGFELTESGTFRLEDITISQHGFKNEEMKQTTSTCTPTTITPYTPLETSSGSSATSINPTSPCNLSTPLSTTPPSTSHMSFLHHDIPYESLLIKRKSRLGSGASANVLRVTYQDKPYALKIIPLYTGELNPSLIVREIRALYASMQCPYVVHFYEAYCREGSIKILLEYMDCNSLDDVYKIAGKIPEDVLSEITYQILQGLKYLQEQKIVHRDIKPSNILLNKQGRVKISDFGMSKQSGASVEAFKTFQGTFMYMSPERLRGDTHSFDSDIWSLGLTVAECALSKFPFNMDQFGVWEVLQYITDNGLDISTKDVSQELLDFITACCQVDPNKRPSAEQLLQYPFITKHNQNSKPDGDYIPERTVKWIEEVYLKKKKQRALSMSGSTSSASSASATPVIRKSSIKEDARQHVSPERQIPVESPASAKTTPRKSSTASLTPRKSSVVESASGTSTPRRSSNAAKPTGSLSRKSSMKAEVHTSSVALDPQKLFEGLEYEGKHDVKEN